jgi:hypothetical protein
VIEELNDYVAPYPEQAIECIEEIVKHVNKVMRLHHWRKPVKEILPPLLEQDGQVAKRASELVQYIS